MFFELIFFGDLAGRKVQNVLIDINVENSAEKFYFSDEVIWRNPHAFLELVCIKLLQFLAERIRRLLRRSGDVVEEYMPLLVPRFRFPYLHSLKIVSPHHKCSSMGEFNGH